MAITLPYVFAPAGSRSGAEVNANLEACRVWLNGRAGTTDIAARAADFNHFLMPEHYGSPMKGSLGTTQDVYGRKATNDKAQRGVFTQPMTGSGYTVVPELAATVTLERAARVSISARFYTWSAIKDVGAPPDLFAVVGYARLFIGGTAKAGTMRRLTMRNVANIDTTAPDTKHECSMVWSEQLAAGEHDIYVGIRCLPHTDAAPRSPINDAAASPWAGIGADNKLIFTEARSFVVRVKNL